MNGTREANGFAPSTSELNNYDVVIVGAGISGINAAYRIQTELQGYNYTILEARDRMGGTWDLFKYPGVRSDSDLYTFGFPWRPWNQQKCIAEGQSICTYLEESAAENGIDKKIQYRHRVIHSNWSSDQAAWQLTVEANGMTKHIHARFIILASGYYDYSNPLKAEITNLEEFKGITVHPQFWPTDLDWENKKIVIIGSGATSVTLLPALAEKAEKVTLLQRSPSYVLAQPAIDPFSGWAQRNLPEWLSFRLIRFKFLMLPFLFFSFCRRFPGLARSLMRKATERELKGAIPHDPHFQPRYNPWEQRLCVCPNGDFFKAFEKGKADVITDTIKTVTETGVETANGTCIPADIIITATGLKIQIGGGSTFSVNNAPLKISEKFLWRGLMLQDLPNIAAVIGYTNASWTLGADATALHVTRLLRHMKDKGYTSATPTIKDGEKVDVRPVLNLNSTYVEKAKADLPKAGNSGPWKPRTLYLLDLWQAKFGNVEEGMRFEKVSS